MKESPHIIDFKEEDKPIAFTEILFKYLRHWPWFILACVLFGTLGYFYEKYAPRTYSSVAKIKILDDAKQVKIIPNQMLMANQNMRLNLENHVEVLKSFKLLAEVVHDLKLDIEYYEEKNFLYTQLFAPPFELRKNLNENREDSLMEYTLQLTASGFDITDKSGKNYTLPYENSATAQSDELPFRINLVEVVQIKDYKDIRYKIILRPKRQAAILLSKALNITTSERQSEVLTLSLKGESPELSEAILNSIISHFDQDGVMDKQLVAKRTLEVIDKRFFDLSRELDTIEAQKQDFKIAENLSNIESDSDVSLRKKFDVGEQVTQLETQISLSKLLKETVSKEGRYNLLPGNIGLDNQGLNNLVVQYNDMVRERQRLVASVGSNHPRLKALSQQLKLGKQNVLNSVNVYESQLKVSLKQQNTVQENAGVSFSKLPEKERMLRSIERQQSIKENLYLLLLRKREEAAIDYAATTPTIKVIDYGLTSFKPMWPKKTIVYPLALILGLLLPFLIIYLRDSLNTKIYSRRDIERLNPEIPVLIEIPFFAKEKSFADVNDRSALAESFRILSTNTDYLLSRKDLDHGKVIFMTSAVKAEGKTLLAMNLSLAYASMGKKVLLVGSDLRNPQLHTYFNIDKNVLGLSDYLMDPRLSFTECLHDGFAKDENHKIYFSGGIPKNAPILLSSKRFGDFLEKAKREFDYVIVDTAPTMLVTDTLLISRYADITLFAARSGVTDKKLLQFSKELNRAKKLKNMAYILNGVGKVKGNTYNYGYEYGYDSSTTSKGKNKKLKKIA